MSQDPNLAKHLPSSLVLANLVGSVICAFIAVATLFFVDYTPGHLPPFSRGLSQDGWVQDGSELAFEGLLSRGNRLLVKFDPWRPPGVDAARFKISVCGRPAGEFQVSASNFEFPISLRGSCEPRMVSFNVQNPLGPTANDPRKLGLKFQQMRLTSIVGLPLPTFGKAIFTALALFYLGIAFTLLGNTFTQKSILSIVPAVGAVACLFGSEGEKWTQALYLWLACTVAALGILIHKFAPPINESKDSNESPGLIPNLIVVGCVLAAGALRLYGVDFGLPRYFHADEPRKAMIIARMISEGSLDPNYFLHPTLLLYLTLIARKILDLTNYNLWPDQPFASIMLCGRTVSALCGTASVYLTYRLGFKLYGYATGIVAAGFLAAFPLHVTCSRYLKEDALMVFWLLLCLNALVNAVQTRKNFWFYLAALCAGICGSSKYTGILAAAPIILTPWLASGSLKPDRSLFKPMLTCLPLVAVGFFMCSPYVILNYQRFSRDFGFEHEHMLKGHSGSIDAWSQLWMFHLQRSLVPGMTLPSLLAGLMGLGLLVYRRKMSDLLVVMLFLAFYLPAEWVKAKPAPQPERYILPCLPFLALAGAEILDQIRRRLPYLGSALIALFIFVFAFTRSLLLASEVENDTRLQMSAWMSQNLKHGSKVLVNEEGYGPEFPNAEFQVGYLSRGLPSQLTLKFIQPSGYDYVVFSSLMYARYFDEPSASPQIEAQLIKIFEGLKLVKEISPQYGSYGFHNPTLRLYKIN